jgi:hypothetical protein
MYHSEFFHSLRSQSLKQLLISMYCFSYMKIGLFHSSSYKKEVNITMRRLLIIRCIFVKLTYLTRSREHKCLNSFS